MTVAEEPGEVPGTKSRRDLALIAITGLVVYVAAVRLDVLESLQQLARRHETWELDELLTLGVFLGFCLAWYSFRRAREASAARDALAARSEKLRAAIAEIRQLKGILPICVSCKKIRDDSGYWQHVETYIEAHTDADFSHGLCPECMVKLYPEMAEDPGDTGTSA